ncbi:MAG: right-handed parallel beta-helix repeat-containing protein [Planctomycetota bacterium]|jgi:parallel beta-helix repeat protein
MMRKLIFALTCLFVAIPCQAEIIYVDHDAPGANNGQNWADAYNYLQDALTDANSALKPVEIHVAEGIYTPDSNSADPGGSGDRMATFQLINGVAIRGGYAGSGEPDPNARDIEFYETILSGDFDGNDVEVDPCDLLNDPTRAENSYHVVTANGTDETAILEGFSITGGNANGPVTHDKRGGGMYNFNYSSPMVTNCTFRGNLAGVGGGMYNYGNPTVTNCTFSGNSSHGMFNDYLSRPTVTNCTFIGNTARYGGGMYNYSESFSKVTNCTFSGNTANYEGGGMYHHYSSSIVTNCKFSGNTAGNDGGGMYNEHYSRLLMTNCTFSGNTAVSSGGGILNSYSRLTVTNCTFIGNTARYSGGMYNSRSSLTVTNCTFSGNTADYGGGMGNYSDSSPTVTNCIFWGDSPYEIYNSASIPTVTYCDIQGGYGSGTGNIDDDPCFVDDTNDFRLLYDSPCVDAGNNSAHSLPLTDLAGNPRVVDSDVDGIAIVDMGAYELRPPRPVLNITQDLLYETIQSAIDDANHGDVIAVVAGTYNEAINFNGKAVRLYSSSGRDVTTIDANGIAGAYHVVQCVSGEDVNTILEGFTITGGNANGTTEWSNKGGGMFNHYSSPTVTNCLFTKNSADWGGGIFSWSSNPAIDNCIIADNSADENGGGIYSAGAVCPTITHCTIVGNVAGTSGGGICCWEGNPAITHCILWDNTANSSFPEIAGTATVSYCDVEGGALGTGNIDADPCFVDVENGDYHLLKDSLCINAGDPNYSGDPGQQDIDGQPRVNDGRVDIGADEYSIGCFTPDHPDYAKWLAAGEPECWCNPRQCHGDADGLMGGSAKTGYYAVGPGDLNILIAAWLQYEPPQGYGVGPIGICADFVHDMGGCGKCSYYRVGPTDLNILISNWMVKEPPFGPGVPADCLDVP